MTPDLKAKLIENPSENYRAEQLISRALQLEPVKGWSYSNTNMVIVGLIIQKITGESHAEQIKKRIMEPLSLKKKQSFLEVQWIFRKKMLVAI